MRRAALPRRVERLAGHWGTVDRGRLVREVAMEFGLDAAEVRAELEEIADRVRRSGPGTPAQAIARCATEFGLAEAELWAEYARITGPSGDRA